MELPNPTFGVPGPEPKQPVNVDEFEIINETRLNESHGNNSFNAGDPKAAASSSFSPRNTPNHINSPGLPNTLFGMSCDQLNAITALINSLKQPQSDADNRLLAEKLINIAPRFDLRSVAKSLDEFRIFFEVNGVNNDSLKFLILQGRLPWPTMVNFGEEHPNCGGNYQTLVRFLSAHTPNVSPSMQFCNKIGKYGEGTLFKDLYHSALMASKLDKNELVKLFCFIFAGESKRDLVSQHMDLPSDRLLEKTSKKWDKTNHHTPTHTTHTPRREYPNNNHNNGGYLCMPHRQYGHNARTCTGFPCEMSRPKNVGPQV